MKEGRWIFEEKAEPTNSININRITKRLVYGEKEAFDKIKEKKYWERALDRPECPTKQTFGHKVTATYNGKPIKGAIYALDKGWKAKGTIPNISEKEKMYLMLTRKFFKEEGYELSGEELIELVIRMLDEKFGVEEQISVSNVNDVKGKQIMRRNTRK